MPYGAAAAQISSIDDAFDAHEELPLMGHQAHAANMDAVAAVDLQIEERLFRYASASRGSRYHL